MKYWLPTLLLLGSCTQLVEFSKTLPAEIVLPEGKQKIIFLSRYDTSMVQYDDSADARVIKDSYRELLDGVAVEFDKLSQFELIISDTIAGGQWFRYTEDIAFTDSAAIEELQKRHSDHFLLTLDLFNIDLVPYESLLAGGFDYETWSYDIICEAALTLRDPGGQVIDQVFLDIPDEVRYRHKASFVIVHPTLKEFTPKAATLSRDLGRSYVQLYSDMPATVIREFYNGRELNESADLIAKKQWPQARELLIPLTKHKNTRIAAKAALNLSVVYEALGDQQASDYWYEKGMSGL
ncbi:MAG: DUF6340 family protein [Cyclobacteriaceae bacterium]|nr:DUF6340 family protein [Cyclobacteriaceae bacterium]